MISIAFMLGAFVGGLIAIYIVGWIVEKFAFRELEPDRRALSTTIAAWLIAGTLAGFGMADGGPFNVAAYLFYLPSAILFFVLHRRKLWKAWNTDDDAETFA